MVNLYNQERPHMSIGNKTPEEVHQTNQKTDRLWKNYYSEPTEKLSFTVLAVYLIEKDYLKTYCLTFSPLHLAYEEDCVKNLLENCIFSVTIVAFFAAVRSGFNVFFVA